MLKIKDDVDLKELEKFGFDDLGVCYKGYGDFDSHFFINKSDRLIKRVHPFSFRDEANEDEMYDLIQAGLVEKVKVE